MPFFFYLFEKFLLLAMFCFFFCIFYLFFLLLDFDLNIDVYHDIVWCSLFFVSCVVFNEMVRRMGTEDPGNVRAQMADIYVSFFLFILSVDFRPQPVCESKSNNYYYYLRLCIYLFIWPKGNMGGSE